MNYLHDFYTRAGLQPSVVDTCHWSVTSDMTTAMLWVHWRTCSNKTKTVKHHMKLVDQQFLRAANDKNNKAMVHFRRKLRNILKWAVGPRLVKIRNAIPDVEKNEAKHMRRSTSATPSVFSKSSSDQDYGGNQADLPLKGSKRRKI